MLGFIGFIFLAVIVGLYVQTSSRLYVTVPVEKRQSFVAAFGLLATTSLVWSLSFFVVPSAINLLMTIADFLLLVATGFMMNVSIDLLRRTWLIIGIVLVGATLLALRSLVFPSTAFVEGGILNFDLSTQTALGIGLIFLAVWLPACLRVIRYVTHAAALARFRFSFAYLFASVILMTSFFLTAQRPLMIILSFISINVLFFVLLLMNQFIRHLQVTKGKGVTHE